MVQVWLYLGAAVAVVFLGWGIDRIDEDARGAYIFRVLMFPGVMVIWPLVLWRWRILATGRDVWQRRYAPPRQAHFMVAIVLTVLVCLTIVLGLSLRPSWPADIAPEQLSAAEEVQ
ncbi:MAG: hypothetical protein AAF641_16300 [Pseudomonadota bacterium]